MRAAVIAALVMLVVAGAGFVVSRELPAAAAPAPANARGDDGGPAAALGEASAEAAGAPAPAEGRAAPASAQSFYQWVDANGSVRFARTLAEVPPAWRDRAGQITLDTDDLIRADRPARRSARGGGAAEAPVRRAGHDVTIYTAPWCGWCRKTIAFLDERGVEYVNKDIDADPSNKDELIEKSGGSSIPVVEIDGSLIRGYSPTEMAALLE